MASTSRARKLFKSYLDAYNAARRFRGLPPVKQRYSGRDLLNGLVALSPSAEELYRDFLESLVDDMWEDADRGFRVRKGQSKAHAASHGSPQQKAKRWAEYQAEVDRLRADHPQWSKQAVRENARKRFGVSTKTIARHTMDKGPRKKT